MRKAVTKCKCGENAFLHYVDKPGRVGDTVVKAIRGVPTYICSNLECGMQFSKGSDSLLCAKRVKEAVEQGLDEISFEEKYIQ